MQKLINKILVVLLMCSMIIGVFYTISRAEIDINGEKIGTTSKLADYAAKNPDQFLNIDPKLFVGKDIEDNPRDGGSIVWRKSGACLFHFNAGSTNFASVRVRDVLDINTDGLNTIKYTHENGSVEGPKEYADNPYVTALAYLLYQRYSLDNQDWNIQSDSQVSQDIANSDNNAIKLAIRQVLVILRKQGVLSSINNTFFGDDGSQEQFTDASKEWLRKALEEGKNSINYKKLEQKSNSEDATSEELAEGTYIGPFKMSYRKDTNDNHGAKVSDIIVTVEGKEYNNCTWAVKQNGTYVDQNGKDIPSDKEFYVKAPAALSSKKIQVTIKTSFNRYYGRMLLISATTDAKQQLTAFVGKKEVINEEITWDVEQSAEITINKTEQGTGTALAGAKFTIQYKGTGKNKDKYVSGDGQYSDKEVRLTTDKDGKIYVKDLIPGLYRIREVEAPEGYELSSKASQTIRAKNRVNITVDVEDEKEEAFIGILELVKLIEGASTETPIEGIEFNIKWDENQDKVQEQKEAITTAKSLKAKLEQELKLLQEDPIKNAQDISEHEDQIYNLDIEIAKAQKVVDYTFETTVKTDKDGKIHLDGLRVGKYIITETGSDNKYFEVGNGENENKIEIEITDSTPAQKVYNKRTYIDLSGIVWEDGQEGKQSLRDDIYTQGETLLEGVKVTLKKDGNAVAETTTDSNGKYFFDGSKDGLKIRVDELDKYSVEYEYNGIKYQSVIAKPDLDEGSKANEIDRAEFNKQNKVTAKTENSVTLGNNITIDYRDTSTAHQKEIVFGNTKVEETYGNQDAVRISATTSGTYNIKDGYKDPAQNSVDNINLGLYIREQPDLAVIKDIQNVKLSINGYNHVYNYASRFTNQGEPTEDRFNVGVKFGNKYGQEKYTRAIYKSDIDFQHPTEASRDLQVSIVYKIAIKNESTTLNTLANTIVDYYDSRYTIKSVGTELDDLGQVKSNSNMTVQEENYNNEYKKALITIADNSEQIKPETTSSIYVQFELDKTNVASIVASNVNGEDLLDNVVEIHSYSTFDTSGNPYAGIDKDSVPANAVPENPDTHEDDTDTAPALKLELDNVARKMTGKVFVDSTTGELRTGEVRQGDGEYKDGEVGVQGVKVTLTEKSGSGKVYVVDATDANGDFTIEGFIPGNYDVTFTWGDETYTVQNYKGTIYNDKERQNNKTWYKLNPDSPRYSDAIDDYALRQNIDNELKKQPSNITIDKMNSITPEMSIGVEYEENGTITSDGTQDEVEFIIKNVDFGIVERARQVMDIDKSVKTVKITLANGQVLVDATVDENGKLQGQISGVSGGPQLGFIKAEVDNELIQGATIEIGYEIKVVNLSELEYATEDFYKYGTPGTDADIVRITPTKVYDYLSEELGVDQESLDTGWQIITEEYFKEVTEPTINEKYNYSEWVKLNEGTLIAQGWIASYEQAMKQEIIEQYKQELMRIRQENYAGRIVLYTEQLSSKALAPGEENSVTLNTSRILASTDEIAFENTAEIVEVDKTGGPTITPVSDSKRWQDEGELVFVTPPTGEDRGYIEYIIIAISSLTLGAVAIYFINKKVIKK